MDNFIQARSYKISQKLLDALSAQAKANPRLRKNYDLHNTPEDNSSRCSTPWTRER
mgnify:CR=1 FL=1